MDKNDIRAKIEELLRDIVDDGGLKITDQTCAANVSWWDSLTHLRLLVAIEEEWKITFQVSEMNAAEDVGQLVNLIRGKMP